jgi:hypothetical protein
VANNRFTHYFKPSSVQQFGTKVAVQWRFLLDISEPVFGPKQFPDGSYVEDHTVFDCIEPRFASAERSVLTKTGDVLYHYKWADPQFVDLSIGNTAAPGTVAAWLRIIACHDELRTPMIAKSNLTSPDLISLASTSNGTEIYFIFQ